MTIATTHDFAFGKNDTLTFYWGDTEYKGTGISAQSLSRAAHPAKRAPTCKISAMMTPTSWRLDHFLQLPGVWGTHFLQVPGIYAEAMLFSLLLLDSYPADQTSPFLQWCQWARSHAHAHSLI